VIPPGKPNPNQSYGCTYTAQRSATATIGVGGAQPGEWVFPECSDPEAVDPIPPVWVTNAQPAAGGSEPGMARRSSHARTTIGVATVPLNLSVVISAEVEIFPPRP
jgi:hypothetical protein